MFGIGPDHLGLVEFGICGGILCLLRFDAFRCNGGLGDGILESGQHYDCGVYKPIDARRWDHHA